MCSHDWREVDNVKKQLFRAGILAEVRSNPLAASLGVTRVELWVQDESDFRQASKVYAGMQAHGTTVVVAEPEHQDVVATEACLELDLPATPAKAAEPKPGKVLSLRAIEVPGEDLDQASSLLEEEIERMLERQGELEKTCASLRNKEQELSTALAEAKSALARETQARVAAENASEALSGRLQAQEAAATELLNELALRESQRTQQEALLRAARAEAATEREARTAAEEQAARSEAARKSAEMELTRHNDLQRQIAASVSQLNSLRTRLQEIRGARREP